LIAGNIIFGNHSRGFDAGYGGGGGILCEKSSPIITNNTIVQNMACFEGGGIYCYNNSSPVITNSIVWDNGTEIAGDSGSSPSVTYCDVKGGFPGTGNIDSDPLFSHSESGDLHLAWNSPCRNSGDNDAQGMQSEDFEGDPRIVDGKVDIGADENHLHLCHLDSLIITGEKLDIVVIGEPGTAPVTLYKGSGIQDPPLITPYGYLYLLPPVESYDLGIIPENGVLIHSMIVPATWPSGEKLPFQVLAGPFKSPDTKLTNLMELRAGNTIQVPPDDFSSIQDAVNASCHGDLIHVKPGTYTENISILGKKIALRSEQGPEVTVIDGNQSGCVVTFHGSGIGAHRLEGFTITNGLNTVYNMGSGIYCGGGAPKITNNIIKDNSVTFIDPPGPFGGAGICCDSFAEIDSNIISGNDSSNSGGGISVSCHAKISNNSICGNSAAWRGGGVFCVGANVTFANNTISGNTAVIGGGICSSSVFGSSSLIMTNNTIFGNLAVDQGGGIYQIGGYYSASCMTVTNTIFWDNDAPEGPEIWIGDPYYLSNVTISYSNVEGGQSSVYVASGCTLDWGPGMIDSDPFFADPANNDFHLTFLHPAGLPVTTRHLGFLITTLKATPASAKARWIWARTNATGIFIAWAIVHPAAQSKGSLWDCRAHRRSGFSSAPVSLIHQNRPCGVIFICKHLGL
jgi:hypothetical protein